MSTCTMDPALRKLLDELPRTDPDKEPEEHAEVWTAFVEGRVIVPVGHWVPIALGPWMGPEMPLEEVILHARILSSGRELRGSFEHPKSRGVIVRPGATISAAVYLIPQGRRR